MTFPKSDGRRIQAGKALIRHLTADLTKKPASIALAAVFDETKVLFENYESLLKIQDSNAAIRSNLRENYDAVLAEIQMSVTLIWYELRAGEAVPKYRGRLDHIHSGPKSMIADLSSETWVHKAEYLCEKLPLLEEHGLPPLKCITKEALEVLITTFDAMNGPYQASKDKEMTERDALKKARDAFDDSLRMLRQHFTRHFMEDTPNQQKQRLVRYRYSELSEIRSQETSRSNASSNSQPTTNDGTEPTPDGTDDVSSQPTDTNDTAPDDTPDDVNDGATDNPDPEGSQPAADDGEDDGTTPAESQDSATNPKPHNTGPSAPGSDAVV